MQNLNYKELQKIEINITKELLKYINETIDMEEILEELDFISPYMQDETNRLAFNVWLSMDYIGNNGKTFIEAFLEDRNASLTELEKHILIEKSYSYVSLFQVLEYEDDYMHLRDILNNQDYKLWEPHLNNAINEGEFIFSRIGKILDEYTFIGDINYLPSSIKPLVLEELIRDFNILRKENPLLTMKEYLKKHSLNVYKIYNESILETIELDGDIHTYLFDELEEFESYLLSKDKRKSVQTHLSNLVNIFEYYLSQEDMTLYDVDQLDLKEFFQTAIDDSFISSQDELNSYISTLKTYISFLNHSDENYNNVYQEILDISENRFSYMQSLNLENGFQTDKNFLNHINSRLNDDALTMIMDYEKFLVYIGENPIELTLKNQYIKRKYLLEINEELEFRSDVNTTSPNQKDFPLIHFFYYLSLNLDILEFDDNDLTLTNRGVSFLRLQDDEKYSILFKYLWSEDFIRYISLKDDLDHWINKRDILAEKFSNLKSNKEYDISDNKDVFLLYNRYLQYFGLIKSSLYNDIPFTITNLGTKVFKYLFIKSNPSNNPTIINLNDYKNIN